MTPTTPTTIYITTSVRNDPAREQDVESRRFQPERARRLPPPPQQRRRSSTRRTLLLGVVGLDSHHRLHRAQRLGVFLVHPRASKKRRHRLDVGRASRVVRRLRRVVRPLASTASERIRDDPFVVGRGDPTSEFTVRDARLVRDDDDARLASAESARLASMRAGCEVY